MTWASPQVKIQYTSMVYLKKTFVCQTFQKKYNRLKDIFPRLSIPVVSIDAYGVTMKQATPVNFKVPEARVARVHEPKIAKWGIFHL